MKYLSVRLTVPHVQFGQPEADHLVATTLSPEINKSVRLLKEIEPDLPGVEGAGAGRIGGPQVPMSQERVQNALHVSVVSD